MEAKSKSISSYQGKYYIGLDIGTNSVGWAVADENMNLLKFNNKHMWGSRLFDEAEKAEQRRIARGLRRRFVRRRVRLNTFNELMYPFVNDENFFKRLKESFYQIEDRSQKNKNILFDDENYTDKHFHKKYPTIYHLRNALCTNTDTAFDPKLIYLAIHHILKYRGNFLYNDSSFKSAQNTSDLKSKLAGIIEILNNTSEENGEAWNCNIEFSIPLDEVLKILLDKKTSNTDKIKVLKTNKITESFIKLILGLKVNIKNIFDGHETLGKEGELKFSDENVEQQIDALPAFSNILYEIKDLYNNIQLQKLMGKYGTISEFMIEERYEKYKEELETLKDVLSFNLSTQEYNNYFKKLDLTVHNYALYTEKGGNCSYDEFKKYLITILNNIKQNSEAKLVDKINEILQALADDNFLKKVRTKDNVVFPKQLNEAELIKILDNQSKFYPYLKQTKGKILQLFNFKIDYFVGPLALRADKNFGWIVKNEEFKDEPITAFNYKQAVNFEESQTKFITLMTSECTYILGQKALPKNSIYYSKFCVIDEINNIRYIDNNGVKPLPEAVRQQIISLLSTTTNVIKQRDIAHLLKVELGTDFVVKMSSEKMNNNLKSLRDFSRILGQEINKDNIDMVEDIIKDITIFGENKNALQEKITRQYNNTLTEQQIKDICKLNYSGWGNLSKKLIVDLKTNFNGKNYSILDLMSTPFSNNHFLNFISIYNNDKFTFKQQVEELNKENLTANSVLDAIQNLAGSPAIKRGIYQAYKIVDEIVHTIKRAPEMVFIEFAREEGVKGNAGKTQSRQAQIKQKYDAIKQNYTQIYNQISKDVLNNLTDKESAKAFNEEKFLLYYLQNGKCAYTGVPLDLNHLEQYDVDHIIPRSLIKDDSLDNKVLVTKQANEKKGNSEVVPKEFQDKMLSTWALWKDMGKTDSSTGLLSAEKFARLTKKYLTDADKNRFINRQLVETRQITKNTAQILETYFTKNNFNVPIKTVRANLNHDFREYFGYYKGDGGRAINDFHHAKDAYITIFTGKYIDTNFKEYSNNYKKYNTIPFSKNQPQDYGYVLYSLKNFNNVWDDNLTSQQALNNFEQNYYYTDIYYTKMTTTNLDGALFKETRYKSEKNRIKFNDTKRTLIPLRKNNEKTKFLETELYGGYTSEVPAFYAIVKTTKKNKTQIKLINVPIRHYIMQNTQPLLESLAISNNVDKVEIIKTLPKYQAIKSNIGLFRITGQDDIIPFNQLVFGRKNKQLYKFIYYVYKVNPERLEDVNYYIEFKESFEQNYKLFETVYKNHIHKYFIKDELSYSKIDAGFEEYKNKSLKDKVLFIKELLIITQVNSRYSSLKVISRHLANLSIDYSAAQLIYQSPTGMHTKVVNIKDLI